MYTTHFPVSTIRLADSTELGQYRRLSKNNTSHEERETPISLHRATVSMSERKVESRMWELEKVEGQGGSGFIDTTKHDYRHPTSEVDAGSFGRF